MGLRFPGVEVNAGALQHRPFFRLYLTGEQGKVRARPALQSGRPGLPQHCSVWDLGVDELQRPPLSENSLIPLFCSQRNHKADVNGLARGSP